MKRIFLLAFVVISQLAHGKCEYDSTEALHLSCKTLPNNNNLTAIVFAEFNEEITKKDTFYGPQLSAIDKGDGRYDLTVLLVNTDNQKVIAKYIKKGALESNALALESIKIDTARYYLEKGSIIFGVRTHNASNSHAYSASYTNLHLFKYKNNKIHEIMDGLEVESLSGNTEDACKSSIYENSETVISVSKSATNGMNDIILNEKKYKEITPNDCESEDANKIIPVSNTKTTIKYDGNKYTLPKIYKKF